MILYQGQKIIKNFIHEICGCSNLWTASNFILYAIDDIKSKVGTGKVICALSGGVDSAVAATLVHRAVGDQLTCIFVDNGLIQNKIIFETKKFKEKFDDLKLNHISHLFISSVVPELNQYFNNMNISVHFVNSENISNIEIGLNNPSELGADLIINASAAYDLTQQRNLVIDHGTALTFCHIDDKGKYLGCLIFPGNHIASQSLAQFTSKLNYFEMKDTNKLYGTNTEEAIGTGLFKGYIHLINGFIKEFKDNYQDIKIIGTGNGVKVFAEYINLDIYEEDLTFRGLKLFAQTILTN